MIAASATAAEKKKPGKNYPLRNTDREWLASDEAVDGAMEWFEANKLMGYRVEHTGERGDPDENTRLVADPDAGPLWGRFYDLENCEIYVCDRDGIPRKSLEEIGTERRNGYSWYNTHHTHLFPRYEQWKKQQGKGN